VFCIYLRTNSDLCHLHHKLIGVYNRYEKCLLRGTNWAFKYSSIQRVNTKSFKLLKFQIPQVNNLSPYCCDKSSIQQCASFGVGSQLILFSGLCIQMSVTLYDPIRTRHKSYAAAWRDPCGTYNVTNVCMHNPENMNSCELLPEKAHCCMLLLAQQYGLGLINLWNLEF